MTQLCLQPCTALTEYMCCSVACAGRDVLHSSQSCCVCRYWSCCMLSLVLVVSLQDEQAIHASPEGLSVHYPHSLMNPEVRGHMTVM